MKLIDCRLENNSFWGRFGVAVVEVHKFRYKIFILKSLKSLFLNSSDLNGISKQNCYCVICCRKLELSISYVTIPALWKNWNKFQLTVSVCRLRDSDTMNFECRQSLVAWTSALKFSWDYWPFDRSMICFTIFTRSAGQLRNFPGLLSVRFVYKLGFATLFFDRVVQKPSIIQAVKRW